MQPRVPRSIVGYHVRHADHVPALTAILRAFVIPARPRTALKTRRHAVAFSKLRSPICFLSLSLYLSLLLARTTSRRRVSPVCVRACLSFRISLALLSSLCRLCTAGGIVARVRVSTCSFASRTLALSHAFPLSPSHVCTRTHFPSRAPLIALSLHHRLASARPFAMLPSLRSRLHGGRRPIPSALDRIDGVPT